MGGEDVRIVHFLPGRLRLKVAAIRGDPAHAERLRAAFGQVPGVQEIAYNTLTGSVLIRYDGRRLQEEDASQRLRATLREYLPGLDADAILSWLHGPLGR
jgi:hypothetical protein